MFSSVEYLDTGQSTWPPPLAKWNGQAVSDGGPLYYCPDRARCRFECTALSKISPDFNIDGRCYSVTELPEAFRGARVDSQHPYYTFEHDCTSGMTFRCVISQTHFSPSYTSEIDGVYFCTQAHARTSDTHLMLCWSFQPF